MEEKITVRLKLEEAVCAISYENEIIGTAFCVNDIYLLSAGHIFENIDKGHSISVIFNKSESTYAIELLYSHFDINNNVDFAILKFLNSNPHFSLPLVFTDVVKGTVDSFGFSRDLNALTAATGNIIGKHYSNARGFLCKINSLEAGQNGFSGGPWYSHEHCGVFAIQSQATDADIGVERDTVFAYPLSRMYEDKHTEVIKFIQSTMLSKPKILKSVFLENYLLPIFGKSMLNLSHSDNLNAYMRCIIVKFLPDQRKRFTVFVAKGNEDLVHAIRKHHKTREMHYGVIGGMLKVNVPIFYDFLNDKCYQLSLAGTHEDSFAIGVKNKGKKEKRIALLCAPIRDNMQETVGVLSFDFFEVIDECKNIIKIIEKVPEELDRILYYSELYACILSKYLLYDNMLDVDFYTVQP